MMHAFIEDPIGGEKKFLVYNQRVDVLGYLGITPLKIGDYCHRFGYKQYLIDIIVSSDEYDLWENYNESWYKMRSMVESFSEARMRGRDCYHTAKDICIDALFTDLLNHYMQRLHPEFSFKKNGQDVSFDLLPNVSLEPDFLVNGKRLEMKIEKTLTDGSKRSNWTDKTFTLRRNEIEPQLRRYKEFFPLYFLRINYEKKVFAVIYCYDFNASRNNDGSLYARINPIKIEPGMKGFVDSLHAELSRKIR